jgi:cytidine deaminase
MTAIPSATLDRLRQAAFDAAAFAYAPYSGFHVGAALLYDDGVIVTGCNIENASFGLTSCAERNAVFRAISERGAGHRIAAVAVANRNGAPSSPCGACRQVLAEFAASDAVVCFPGEHGPEMHPFRELFPFSFSLESR